MPKIVPILILPTLFSLSMYAVDLTNTNEILNQATEATKELTAQLEPIINEEIVQENIENIPLEDTPFIEENFELNETIVIHSIPIESNLSTPNTIENIETPAENNSSESNITEKTEEIKEEIKEKEVVEKGDPRKGKNIFKYVLKDDCNMTAYKFAEKHTQEEWIEVLEENKIKETIFESCPNVKKYYQDKWTDDLYQFFYEASNEDEIPEC